MEAIIRDVFLPVIEDYRILSCLQGWMNWEKEDLFFIRVCGEILAYCITEREIMEPEEAEMLEILPEKDLCNNSR